MPSAAMRLAAIDVGTNTVRLLVADSSAAGLARIEAVERRRQITRLGQGLDAVGRLAPDAIVRTVDAIGDFAAVARRAGADRIRIAGTSAVRDAADRDAFMALVVERTGVELELLSGVEEGRISYLGATAGLEAGEYVVCDIGGGSTELSVAGDSVSLDIGSVRLRERCLHGDPPTSAEIEDARAVVNDALGRVGDALRGSFVGVAGTITTLTAIVLRLTVYERDLVHGAEVSREDVTRWSERLLSMSAQDIVALGPVEPGRADLIGGGSLILASVMDRWSFDHVLVSERDILDGLVLDLVEKLA